MCLLAKVVAVSQARAEVEAYRASVKVSAEVSFDLEDAADRSAPCLSFVALCACVILVMAVWWEQNAYLVDDSTLDSRVHPPPGRELASVRCSLLGSAGAVLSPCTCLALC